MFQHHQPAADDCDLVGLEDEERRRVIRQKRNRLSAQLSRDRKKNYVNELEGKVQGLISQNSQLTSCCKKLLQENRELREKVTAGRGQVRHEAAAQDAMVAVPPQAYLTQPQKTPELETPNVTDRINTEELASLATPREDELAACAAALGAVAHAAELPQSAAPP